MKKADISLRDIAWNDMIKRLSFLFCVVVVVVALFRGGKWSMLPIICRGKLEPSSKRGTMATKWNCTPCMAKWRSLWPLLCRCDSKFMGKRSSDVFFGYKEDFPRGIDKWNWAEFVVLPLCWPRVKRASAEPSLRRRRPDTCRLSTGASYGILCMSWCHTFRSRRLRIPCKDGEELELAKR